LALHLYYFIVTTDNYAPWAFSIGSSFFSELNANSLIRIAIALSLISIQGIFLNGLVTKHKFSRALSTIPGLTFILFSCFVLNPIILHPILIANLFLILALSSLFKLYKKFQPVGTIFNSGFYLGCAVLVYQPYLVYLVVLLTGLYALRNLNLREFLQMIFGFLLPFYLLQVVLWHQGTDQSVISVVTENFSIPNFNFDLEDFSWLKLLITMLIIGYALLGYNEVKKKKKFDAIKKIEIAYWMLLLSIPSLLFIPNLGISHLLILSVPIGLLVGLLLEAKKYVLVKEFSFLLFLAVHLAFLFGAF